LPSNRLPPLDPPLDEPDEHDEPLLLLPELPPLDEPPLELPPLEHAAAVVTSAAAHAATASRRLKNLDELMY
jgi:hypothetical protein